jgi:hypothetical protein
MKKGIKGFFVMALIIVSSSKLFAQASVSLSINIAPPALPVYTQPLCPADGYLWVPGYWAYDNNNSDYYWVPGVWVSPPHRRYLWTPGYWAYDGSNYNFHAGYWGAHVGFYGGVNYGYGYGGSGFGGGRWVGNSFSYNTAVVNINRTVVKNTYIDNTVVVNTTTINNRASFNGRGGVSAKPRPEELTAMKERHVQPTTDQLTHQQTAMANRSQHASANHGKPAVTAYNKVNGDSFGQKGRPARVTAATGEASPNNNNVAHKQEVARQKVDRPEVARPVTERPKQPTPAAENSGRVRINKTETPERPKRQPAQHAEPAHHAVHAEHPERAREKQPREK